jgi:hypothetical protein
MKSLQTVQRPSLNATRRSALCSSRIAVGPASDACEREADRVAHTVTLGPDSAATLAVDRMGPNASQTRSSGTADGAAGSLPEEATQSVHQVLRSPGEPLDSPTRVFMERRFRHDFSRVSVHKDSQAADSARAVGAVAYTVGNQLVFGHGCYQPQLAGGLRLIAHELAHTVQRGTDPHVIRRAVNHPAPSITTENPIDRVLAAQHGALALTSPTINGNILPPDFEAGVRLVKTAFTPRDVESVPSAAPAPGSGTSTGSGSASPTTAPQNVGNGSGSGSGAGSGSASPTPARTQQKAGSGSGSGSGAGSGTASPTPSKAPQHAGSGSGAGSGAGSGSGSGSGGTGAPPAAIQCRFKDFNVDVSANIRQPSPPSRTQWGPRVVDGSTLPGAPSICARNNHISVTMIGKPTTQDFYNRLVANEQEHVTDLRDASNRFLIPYYRSIMALRGAGSGLDQCRADLNAQLGRIPETLIRSFLNEILAGVRRRDVPGGHPTREATHVTEPTNCNTMEIIGEPTPPPPRGGTP